MKNSALLLLVLALCIPSSIVLGQSMSSPPAAFSQGPKAGQAPHVCGVGEWGHRNLNPIPDPEDYRDEGGSRMPPLNVQAYTQSIHNVIAKWDAGAVYRFDFGTSPGNDDIYNGHLLNPWQRNTIGHSFPELQAYAAAQATNFNVGDTFYLNLYDTPTSPAVSYPLVFQWENLGNPANVVTINIETNYGLNGVGPFNGTQAAELATFYNLVNPIVKEVYGPPARNHTVNVVNDGYATGTNVYYNGPNQISTSYRINASGDLDQPRLLIHELVHAYRDNLTLSMDSTYHYHSYLEGFEEGMAEAVAIIVMDIFIERYPNFFNGDEFKIHWNQSRGMPFEWTYDFNNHEQVTTQSFFSTDIATGSHWLRYGLGAAAMKKCYIEDSLFFVNFNAEYYARLNNNHALIPDRAMMLDVIQTVKPTIEREPASDWVDRQHIFDCTINQGKKVFMLSFTQSNWASFQHDNRIFFLETHENGLEWRWNSSDPAGLNEVPDAHPNADYAWTHQMNQTPGLVNFVRDWNSSNFRSKNIVAGSHWINEAPNGLPAYIGTPLLGPYQGPNPYYVGATFTRDHEQDNCTAVPGCGRRAWAIGSQTLYSTTSTVTSMWPPLVSNGGTIPNNRAELNMNESGLFRFEIGFNDSQGPTVSDSHYRLLGDNFIDAEGVYGGIYSDLTDQIGGRMIIEHEDFGLEADVNLFNNAFVSSRVWASILETDPNRQGGRNDRRYSVPGEVHAIYLDSACSMKKIDFRTIGYGDGLDGTEMLLFDREAMEDIVFTESNDTTINVGQSFILGITNNFPDILDGDPRINYTWLDPNGNPISTDSLYTFFNAAQTDSGTYSVEIDFMGCPIFSQDVVVNVNGALPVEGLAFRATLNAEEEVDLEWDYEGDEAVATFVVERSKDASGWEKLLERPAESGMESYQDLDSSPILGNSYYRLNVVLENGASRYSDIRNIFIEGGGSLTLYPNPGNESIYLETDRDILISVEICDLLGRKIRGGELMDENSAKIWVKDLPEASYLVRVQSQNGSSFYKVLVRHH